MRRLTIAIALLAAGAAHGALAKQDDERLDPLFDSLAQADDPGEVQAAEQGIWKVWLEHDSPTVRVLLGTGIRALGEGNHDQAIEMFDAVTDLAPDFAEGWNKRATVRFLIGDFAGSTADIERTLALEPRHFGALSGLGQIMEQLGNLGEAVKAYRRAIAANPHLSGARQRLESLKRRLEGSPI